MKYSFTQPREKHLFKTDTKLWLVFTFVMMCGIIGGDWYLYSEASTLQSKEESLKTSIVHLKEGNKKLEEELEDVKHDVGKMNDISTRNLLLKETMQNLFDVVPDQIILSRVELTTNTLIVQGVTPTKDLYEYMLYPPLKSIFKTTKTSFSPTSGGYIFVSVNRKEPTEEKGHHE